MPTHRLFSLTLASERALPIPPGEGGLPDLTLTLSLDSDHPRSLADFHLVYRGKLASLHRSEQCEVLRFPRLADFHLGKDWIISNLAGTDAEATISIPLLGPVLSYWLERRGLPTLHASAVAVNGRAAVFLSASGGGKTGLAAAMMRGVNSGHPLLTDDILPLEERDGAILGRPGYPQMRMWPDEAEHFLGGTGGLELVHPALTKRRVPVGVGGFGGFHDSALPLACLYVPERRPEGPVEIRTIPPRDALIELVRHSFSPHLVEAAGLQPARLDLFARLVRRVPVRRLLYPSGFDHLPRVVEAVLRDLDESP
jgi:hypothetical protein